MSQTRTAISNTHVSHGIVPRGSRRIPACGLAATAFLGALGMLEECLPYDAAQGLVAAEYDRPAANLRQSRSAVIAQHGMVATSHPLAAQAGLDILRAGGTAADVAIAASAMIGLVEPMSCGIGGDLFIIYWDAKTRKLHGLNASGRSPYELNLDVFREKKLKSIPVDGPLSWSVPGCVDGWDELRRRFGRMEFEQLLEPSIVYAENGFPVTDIIARSWGGATKAFEKWPDSAATYLPEGRAPREGELFRNPRLAATYRLIAADGRDGFYHGRIAEKIVAFSEANGGYFTRADFDDHRSEWVEPVSTNYRGYDVWELPPNGQGIAALQMLNVLEGYDVRALGRNSTDYWHLFVEAKKLAFADRATFYADPAFAKLPVKELISKEYAERRRKLINPRRAAREVPPGDPRFEHGDTIYLCVVDKDRNCCSLIQSNFFGFGSKVTPGDVGFVLQNRGALFALDETHLNRLEPHKRPFHTIIPAMVTKDGRPWLVFGVMGGDMQPQGHVQIVVNMVDFGMNVQQAGDAARLRHLGSQSPTGDAMAADGGAVAVESTIPADTVHGLIARGHNVVFSPGTFGGYQGIYIDWENGTLHGGTDPRKDGTAVGY
ncbi:MAG TPA: gamma-glutamyltransferase [Planctomycetaceae bacterium]|nr:gamma-glutamyltransferase [Planctomycetaceae bacterium]